jgi:hypothetical protein
MSAAISTNVASASAGAANPIQAASAAKASAAATPATALKSDTVKLSFAAQIRSLHHQGISPSQIASRLGVSVTVVSGYIPGSAAAPQAVSVKTAAPAPVDTDADATGSASVTPGVSTKPDAAATAPRAVAETPKAPVETAPLTKGETVATK